MSLLESCVSCVTQKTLSLHRRLLRTLVPENDEDLRRDLGITAICAFHGYQSAQSQHILIQYLQS